MGKTFYLLIYLLIPGWLWAGEKDLYDFLWLDPDKSVYVLQNKLYPKNKTYYADVGYILGLSNEFQDVSGVQFKLGYYFSEDWGLELAHRSYSNQNNSTFDSVKAVNKAEPFSRKPIAFTGAYLIWSPFYGKINTFNKIFYFDWSFGLGSGSLNLESNLESARAADTQNTYESENYVPISLKTNLKFHLNQRIHLGVEFSNMNYQAGTPKNPTNKEWRQLNDLIFSLGMSF